MKLVEICLFFFFFGWLAISSIFSQTETNLMKHERKVVLDKVMNIEYRHPAGFTVDSLPVCLDLESMMIMILVVTEMRIIIM